MQRQLWIAAMSAFVLGVAGKPAQAEAQAAFCIDPGGTCANSAECCSNRCNFAKQGDPSGTCLNPIQN